MPHLANGEENTLHILALHAVNRQGQLYDPVSVEFVIYDWDTGSPVQVFPASGREDVTGEGDYTGVYPANDVALASGVTPGTSWGSVNEGKHTIKWWFTDYDDTSIERTWEHPFEVSAAGLAMGVWSYVTPAEIRQEGLPSGTVDDVWLLKLMMYAQEMLERLCKQPFRPVYQTFIMDGTGNSRLTFPVPIIGIDYVKANYTTQELNATSYHVYAMPALRSNGPVWLQKDDRRNPKIEMVTTSSIYSGRSGGYPGIFASGAANQDIGGVFGFVEPNGQTPQAITRAMMSMVFNMATRLTSGGPGSPNTATGALKRLKVDRHEQEWDNWAGGVYLTDVLATSPEVEKIIKSYRAPTFMAIT